MPTRFASLLTLFLTTVCRLPGEVLAPTPPMGWNSWDAYGTGVTEVEVKRNADYMRRHLADFGWRYIVVDIQWYEPNPKAHGYRPGATFSMDSYGRFIPAPNRFPSASGGAGFKPLADYVHSLGLRFGIHILRGIPRQAVEANTPVLGTPFHAAEVADRQSVCPWNTDMYGLNMQHPGAQAYIDSLLQLYAGWGVDYIKADDEARPLHRDEVAGLHQAIVKSRRPIVLSLSPGPAKVEDADFLAANAQLWRVSDDLWDKWKDVRAAFDYLANWQGHAGPGHWPDADMLPLGHIGIRAERGNDRMSLLTHDEQRTLLSLWSITQSPLMFGGDLPTNDDWTLSLLTNREVIAVNQNASHPRRLYVHDDQICWVSDAADPKVKYVAFFNVSDSEPRRFHLRPQDLNLPGTYQVRNLWDHLDVRTANGVTEFVIPPHGSVLLSLTVR